MDQEKDLLAMAELPYIATQDPRIKKRGEWYHARFSCKGQRVQESLDTKNWKVAVQLTDNIEKSILIGVNWKQEAELFADAWPEFLEDKATGKRKNKGIDKVRPKTLKEYIHIGERYYLPFFGDHRVDRITTEDWDQYMAFVRGKSRSGDATKMLNHWKYLSAFYTWAIATERVHRAPDIYNPDPESDEEDGIGLSLTDDQLWAFRRAAEGPSKLWIFMAQYMGMRSKEITHLQKDRIDFGKHLIKLRKSDTKNKQARTVPIHPEVMPLLFEQLTATASDFLFPNRDDKKRPMDVGGFRKPWDKLRQSLGIDCRFHDFRHSHATRAFGNPKLNPVAVSKYLGMSMKTAMKHYIHYDDSVLADISQAFQLGEG